MMCIFQDVQKWSVFHVSFRGRKSILLKNSKSRVGGLGSITLRTLLVLQASHGEVGLRVNLLACIAVVGQKPHTCWKSDFQEGRKECFSYRFQGPRGHETHSAHNWLCKLQLKYEREKQSNCSCEGFFTPWLQDSSVFSSLPADLDQNMNTHTDILLLQAENTADVQWGCF